jgi:hypothetical protein
VLADFSGLLPQSQVLRAELPIDLRAEFHDERRGSGKVRSVFRHATI